MNHYVFKTQADALTALDDINAKVLARIREQNPEIIDDAGIIPVNAGDGSLAIDLDVRVTGWAEIMEYQNGWGFPVLSNDFHPVLEGLDLVPDAMELDYDIVPGEFIFQQDETPFSQQ